MMAIYKFKKFQNSTTYFYRIKCVKDDRESEYSSAFEIQSAEAIPPLAPTDLDK